MELIEDYDRQVGELQASGDATSSAQVLLDVSGISLLHENVIMHKNLQIDGSLNVDGSMKEENREELIKSIGRTIAFDCLINNASLFENDKLENFKTDSWEKHMSINLRAPAYLSKEFSKNIKKGNNNIINIIDQRVFKLTPYFFSYTISKTGLYTLTKTSAMSLSPNIRVNGIAPGPTIKNKRQSEQHFKKQYLATPLKKQVNVREICNAVDFFIKNRSITGQILAIDSGQSLNWQTPDIMGGKE